MPAPSAHSRLRLRSFGAPSLAGADGATILGTHGHHRRRLALLSVLAAAGDRGRSRDQLLLLFWPESTQARARHSLDQLLYALRTSLGDDFLAGTNPVRLNDALVGSDVADFDRAIERGDLEAAAALYSAPFLDGFYLDDAPEFERWVEAERARYAGRHAAALERLARRDAEAGDHRAAARWWAALAASDPLSSRFAAGLIRALHAAGDHADALRAGRQHETALRQALGVGTDPHVAALVREVRDAATMPTRVGPARPTPRGALTERDAPMRGAPRTSAPAAGTGPLGARGHVWAIGLVLLIALSVGLVASRRPPPATVAAPPRSIAVLPFANVRGDPRDAAFVDGLGEEVIAALWRVPELHVTARSSSFILRPVVGDARAIGAALGVRHLLEGSVERNGGRLRVRVRLVDAGPGVTRWSETYDRDMADVFSVQSEIAAAVARELDLRLVDGGAGRRGVGSAPNIAAYELYLRGRDAAHLRSVSDSGPRLGLALLQRSLAIDSMFAPAHASMPLMYFGLAGRAPTPDSSRALSRRAHEAARRALALAPGMPDAHMGLAIAHATGVVDLGASEAALRRALSLGGAPRLHELLSRVLMWSGRHAEALVEAQRATREDPLSPTAAADLGEALCATGRHVEGLAQLTPLERLHVPLQRVAGFVALCHAMAGNWQAAARRVEPLAHARGPILRGYYLARAGDTAGARIDCDSSIARWRRTGRDAMRIALTSEGLGDRSAALSWLERAADDPALTGIAAMMYPFFADLRQDPRFARLRPGFRLASGR